HGTPILANGKLIIQCQWGEIRVVEATPDKYNELANARVFNFSAPESKCPLGRATFGTPVLLNKRLYCRDVHGEVICLDLDKASYVAGVALPAPVPFEHIVGQVGKFSGMLTQKEIQMDDTTFAVLTENQKTYQVCTRHNPGLASKVSHLVGTA